MCDRKNLFFGGWLFLIIGALFTLQDYGVRMNWFRFSGWAILFIILGVCMMMKSCYAVHPKIAGLKVPVKIRTKKKRK